MTQIKNPENSKQTLNRPTLKEWFKLNLKMGALSFGGAGRSLIFQECVVDQERWLTDEEFREIFTLAQVLPGPNLVNLAAYMGYRLLGKAGAILGLLALGVPGALLAVLVATVLDLQNFHIATLFQGFSLGSLILFCIFLYRFISGIKYSIPASRPLSRIKFFARILILAGVSASVFVHVPLNWILLIGIPICIVIEFAL